MKSAYERALEKLDSQGIDRPEELGEEVKEKIAEVRRKAEAKLAEAEIMYRESLQKPNANPAEAEEHFQIDRRRIEADRDREIEKLRG